MLWTILEFIRTGTDVAATLQYGNTFLVAAHGSMGICGNIWAKVLGLAYNRRKTRDKRPLGKDPDRSWCHRHTIVNLSWSQPMA